MSQKKKYLPPMISYWGQRPVGTATLSAAAVWDEQTEAMIASRADQNHPPVFGIRPPSAKEPKNQAGRTVPKLARD